MQLICFYSTIADVCVCRGADNVPPGSEEPPLDLIGKMAPQESAQTWS